jgi:hypothetical protein
MAKKQQLNSKIERIKLKSKKSVSASPIPSKKIYLSEFCLTDNFNFAIFNVPERFLLDNALNNTIDFELSEHDLQMVMDRKQQLIPNMSSTTVAFHPIGIIKREYFDLVTAVDPECVFAMVIEWFGRESNRLIAALHKDMMGKPFGILKIYSELN